MIRKTQIVTLSLAVTIAATGLIALAGDLNPPVGPVTPTMKTLTEIEPRIAVNTTNTPGDADSLFKITQPGSYYLMGNISGVAAKHGIEIVASGVTLDLNGFDLVGVAAMGAFDGVSATVGGLVNIAVVNGSVRNWGDEGVDIGTNVSVNCRVADVLASGNTGNGITAGTGGTVSNCSASSNTAHGIVGSTGCTVTNCSTSSNTGSGIFTGNGSTVAHCSASANTVHGITTLSGCMVSACSAFQNGANGISAASGSTVTNCSAHLNTGTGIAASSSCTISNCSALSNTSSGVNVGSGSMVADCTARTNTLDGILCGFGCVIRGNTCSSNGNGAGDGAGIHATFNDNRIEGNNCTVADRGIDVDLAGNIIIRNTCSGNTIDWVIAANNVFGPIIDRRAPASAAVSGFTAASSLGSTDANANFSY